jgi:hypothetical protein
MAAVTGSRITFLSCGLLRHASRNALCSFANGILKSV